MAKKRKRKSNIKKTIDVIRKAYQLGGQGPLGSRSARELPPKEFEDAGIPRPLPPITTPKPSVN